MSIQKGKILRVVVLLMACSCWLVPRDVESSQEVVGAQFRDETINLQSSDGHEPYESLGTVTLIGGESLHVRQVGTWKIRYTVSPSANAQLEAGGGIRVVFLHAQDWGEPQVTNLAGDNYVTATTNGDATLNVEVGRQFGTRFITVTIVSGNIGPGESIEIIYGDTSGGSQGALAPRWAQEREEWFVYERRGSSWSWSEQPVGRLAFSISGGVARRLVLIGPSEVKKGEPFRLLIRAEDDFRNRAEDFSGNLTLTSTDPTAQLPVRCKLSPDDRGCKFVTVTLNSPGIHTVTGEDIQSGIRDVSNPIRCVEEWPDRRTYWADFHFHSDLSDGNRTPEQLYHSARDEVRLDIAAITDHGIWRWAPPYDTRFLDHTLSEEDWDMLLRTAAAFYEPGRFVTFAGYEYSHSPQGDWNVYFLSDNAKLILPFNVPELLSALQSENVFCVPHVGGRRAHLGLIDTTLVPAIEIVSNHGRFEDFGMDTLSRGYLVGFLGSSDGHAGSPGRSVWGTGEGLMAVRATCLTREGVAEAIKARRSYAVTDPTDRPLLEFQINGHYMGEVFTAFESPLIRVEAASGATIRTIEVVRNGQVIYAHQGKGRVERFSFRDDTVVDGVNWYYIRMTNQENQVAWSSPIWVLW